MTVQAFWPDGVPQPKMAYSPALRAGDWVFVSGQLASDFATGLAAAARPTNTTVESTIGAQSRYVLPNLAATSAAVPDADRTSIVRCSRWFTGAEIQAGDGIRWSGHGVDDYLAAEPEHLADPGAVSIGGISELMVLGTELEVDIISRVAANAATPVTHGDEIVGTTVDGWTFLSAVARPIDPRRPFDVLGPQGQTEAVLVELEARAASAGLSLDRAAKAEIFVRDVQDVPAVERAWRQRFGAAGPAKVLVASVAPRHPAAAVEVALTLLSESAGRLETISAPAAAPAIGSGPQAVLAGDLLFLSTQVAAGPDGQIADGAVRSPNFPWYTSPGRTQMTQLLSNVDAICAAAGADPANVVRRVCYHEDLQWFAESIAIWAEHFPGVKPASTTLRTAGPLGVAHANVLLDLIVYAPDGATTAQ